MHTLLHYSSSTAQPMNLPQRVLVISSALLFFISAVSVACLSKVVAQDLLLCPVLTADVFLLQQ